MRRLILLPGVVLLLMTAVWPARAEDPSISVMVERATAAQVAAFAKETASRVERVPGVERAALTNYLPLSGGMNIPLSSIVGRPQAGDRFLGNLEWFGIAPGFFDVMRIRLRNGRVIEERDTSASPPVVVVNEAFAKRYFT